MSAVTSFTMLSLAELRRAQSWNPEIITILLGSDVSSEDVGHNRCWRGTGGLHCDLRDGSWYNFAERVGGRSAVRLVRYLKDCSKAEAIEWTQAFLASHAGDGLC